MLWRRLEDMKVTWPIAVLVVFVVAFVVVVVVVLAAAVLREPLG
jgi:hypothetical protein